MPSPKRHIDEADLVARYEAGATVRELASELGFSDPWIYVRLREAGATMRGRGEAARASSRACAGEVERLYLAGNSARDVAQIVDRSDGCVLDMLRERNVEIRPAGSYKAGRAQSIETKLRRAATKEQGGLMDSTGEVEFRALLDEAGIEYLAQKAVGFYNVDFCLPALGLAVEIKGAFHRAHHTRYVLASERTAFIESQGWRVVVLTPPFPDDVIERLTSQERSLVPSC